MSTSNAYKSVMMCAQLCRECVAACVECMRMCQASAYSNTKAAKDCIEACHHCVSVCEFCAIVCEEGNLAEIEKACRDCVAACDMCMKACQVCAEKCPDCKEACQYCYNACARCSNECQKTMDPKISMDKMGGMDMAMPAKFTPTRQPSFNIVYNSAVKVAGNWKLTVKAVPFDGRDSDGQFFDASTDIMENSFQTPVGLYQHGIKRGGKQLQDKVIVIGQTVPGTLRKKSDGWYLDMDLDPSKDESKSVMDAAWKGQVAVSSDSVSHLARLEVGGKTIMYEKNRAGRISVWPLAGVSMWEMGGGNFAPASRLAVAMPAMKAIYREAGLRFPDVSPDTYGVPEADEARVRARIAAAKNQSQMILKRIKER